jgi:ribosome-associated translation inhibitor RaiA
LTKENAMQMEIITRHFTLSDEQRELIEAAVEKLERFSPRPVQGLKLTIAFEAGRFFADSVLHLKAQDFRAKGEAMEPEFAVNEMVENLRPQLIKFKGKISGRQKGEEGGLGRAMVGGEGIAPPLDVPAEGFVLRDMDLAAAKAAFRPGEMPFLIFRNVDTSRIGVVYQRDNGEVGHMESQND